MINNILLFIISLSFIVCSEKAYWDLGVIINSNNSTVLQKEVNIDLLIENQQAYNEENVKALHSINFIPPILYELKTHNLLSTNSSKKYDDFVYSLSIPETIKFFKKSFLKNQYTEFFSTHKVLNKESFQDDLINLMYIQKLYHTNQFEKAIESLNDVENKHITDELLFYKIKTDIKLKNYDNAQKNIELFIEEFHNSDLLRYVIYEKKLLIKKNEK